MITESLRILLVDDDAVDRQTVRRALQASAMTVELRELEDAEGLVEALCEYPADCVLLDLRLPRIDGLEALRRLRDSGSSTPVVILTGYGDEQTAVELMKEGANDYVPKATLQPERLAQCVRQAIRVAQAEVMAAEARAMAASHNARLQQLAETATRAKEARDEMVAIVSHDLRNPLNTVLMSATLLGRSSSLDEKERAHLQRIERAARQMNELISNLLDLSRLDAGAFVLEPSAQSPAAIVEEAIDLVRPLAASRGLALSVEVPPSLPEITCDRARLQQVFSNLLGNALKLTPKGGAITVRAAAPNDGFVHFAVADTGPGIPREHLARLFDRYWQGNRKDRTGAGLGLFIAEGIVAAHGGALSVESTLGEGSTFHFTVPERS